MRWRDPVARGALLLMEALWVYALVALVMAIMGGPEQVSLLGAGLVVIVSYTLSRLLQSSDLDLGILRLWGIVASLLLFYAIVRIDLFDDWRLWDFTWADRFAGGILDTVQGHAGAVAAIPLLWVIWLRGVSRGQDPLMFEAVVSSFATGVVVIVVVQLLANAVGAPAMIGYVAVPYMALGLLAIGLAHAARSELEYGRSFSATWLLAIGGAVLAMSLIAFVFVLLDLATIRDGIAFVGGWIGRVFLLIFFAVTYVVAIAVEAIVRVVFWALGMSAENPPPEEMPDIPQPEENAPSLDPGIPDWIWWLARAVSGLSIVAVAAAVLYLTFSRFIKRRTPDVMKESTYSEGRLGADLGNLLSSMLGRLRPGFNLGGEADPVRRLYFEMLEEAESRGIERAPGQTPLELEPALREPFGDRAPAEITAAFDDARYGGLPAAPERVRSLRAAWDEAKRSP